jgi:asparagine synthase (glutamine-hydrolysing)
LYYFQEAQSLIFSRELKFIVPFLSQVEFCKDGILEYLLFGFPFEENTLVEKVGFFPPATYLSFDMASGKSARDSYHVLNIDRCVNSGGRKKMAAEMCRIFMEALSKRAEWVDKNKTIVSLSGGFDSRGTLAGLKKLGLSPSAVTAQSEEEGSARKVAGFLGVEIYPIPQGHAEKERPFADIVFLKDGLDCHPDLAQLYRNLQDLRDRFGKDIIYFTGIYGGEITRQSHPTAGLSSLKSLVRYLLKANDSYKYSTEKVAAILRMPENEISNHLQRRLETFPEKSIWRKYLRFRHEFDMRFAGEAEDRNRFFFWTISPFFAFPFFNYVMGIDENRKTSRLFRDFLYAIDPNTCKAKYFNYHLPLNNQVTLWALAFAERMSRHVFVKNSLRRMVRLMKACRGLFGHSNAEEKRTIKNIRIELIDLLANSNPIRDFFNNPGLPSLIMRENDITGLERLRIVFAYLDRATHWHALLRENPIVAPPENR